MVMEVAVVEEDLAEAAVVGVIALSKSLSSFGP